MKVKINKQEKERERKERESRKKREKEGLSDFEYLMVFCRAYMIFF